MAHERGGFLPRLLGVEGEKLFPRRALAQRDDFGPLTVGDGDTLGDRDDEFVLEQFVAAVPHLDVPEDLAAGFHALLAKRDHLGEYLQLARDDIVGRLVDEQGEHAAELRPEALVVLVDLGRLGVGVP